MTGGFNNPLTGQNGSLIYAQVKSPNYEPGVSGWAIKKDGTAEFNNVDVRGTLVGAEYVANDLGIFVYSGSPAAGNMILSVAAQGGTDSYGNVYIDGITSYDPSSSTFAQLINGMLNVGAVVSGTPDVNNSASFSYIAGAQPFLDISSALVSAIYTDPALLLLQPGKPGQGTGGVGRPLILGIDNNASSACDINISGGLYRTSLDGTTPELWNTATLLTGFSSQATDQAPRFRLEPTGKGIVRLDGVAFTTGATAAGAKMFAIPSEYTPTENKEFVGVTSASGYTADGQHLILVSATGFVVCGPATSAANQKIVLDGISYPID